MSWSAHEAFIHSSTRERMEEERCDEALEVLSEQFGRPATNEELEALLCLLGFKAGDPIVADEEIDDRIIFEAEANLP